MSSTRYYIFDRLVTWSIPGTHRYERISEAHARAWLSHASRNAARVTNCARDLLTCGYILNHLASHVRDPAFRREFLREDRPPEPSTLRPDDQALIIWWNDGVSPPDWEHAILVRKPARPRGFSR